MKCPHCRVVIHNDVSWQLLGRDGDGVWGFAKQICPACGKMILVLARGRPIYDKTSKGREFTRLEDLEQTVLVHPRGANRALAVPEVRAAMPDLADDFDEACLVLTDSPKASAALSRRCLQHLLRERAGVKKSDLVKEIQEALDTNTLPSHLAESLDAVRQIGNFAAHPTKSQSSGEVVPVEEGEAEWNLDTLEGLFDFYFVQPAATARRKAALDAKLKDAGKRTK